MDIICGNEDFFKNPRKLPLNELYLDYKKVIRTFKQDVTVEEMLKELEKPRQREHWRNRYEVKVEKKPALDKCWLQKERKYVEFQPYYPQFDDNENEQFVKQNLEFLEILEHLAKCTYHQFWCYVACEPRVSFVIKSFLQHSVPLYGISYLNDEFLSLYNEIYSSVCRIYERLLKFNVSEVEYMSENFALGVLKSTELLSGSCVFSFCYLYNSSNPQFVKRLIDFCLSDKCKDEFYRDITDMLAEVLEELDRYGGNLVDLPQEISKRYKIGRFDPVWLEETSLYLLEMAAGWHEFCSVCKPAVDVAFTLELPKCLSHVYQKIYLQMFKMLEGKSDIGYDWSRYETLINRWLAIGRSEFVDLFYEFTSHCIDAILRLKDDRREQEDYLETYIGLISNAMDDYLFIKDYNMSHPLALQFQILSDNIADFDKTQTEYLLNNLAAISIEPEDDVVKQEQEFESVTEQGADDPFPEDLFESIYDTLSQYVEAQQSSGDVNSDLPDAVAFALEQCIQIKHKWGTDRNLSNGLPQLDLVENKSVNKPSEEEIERRIQAVLDMLPDLGTGFILKCLEKMDYKPEQVISRVLDEELPFDLIEIPRDSTRGTSEYIEKPGPSRVTQIVPQSFDMPGPSRVIETKPKYKIVEAAKPKFIAYKGKKPGYADAKQLLDDKKAKEGLKEIILKAAYTYDADDDYDDRVDIYNPFENDIESKIYKYLDQPEYDAVSDPSSGDSEDDDEKPRQEKSSNAFCEDPAVVRARRAAQRGRIIKGPGPSRNVVGKPKGQGQDNAVKHDRDKKHVHKSNRANHHRKGGAQWKRNKGMIPS